MRKRRLLLLLAALVLFWAIIFVYKPQLLTEPFFRVPVPKRNLTIVALGDSLTKGEGDIKRGGYVGYVQNHLKKRKHIGKVTVYNYGVIGDTSDDLLKVMQSKNVLHHIDKADLILFTIGGNDVMGVVKDHFLGMTLDMFKKAKKHYKHNVEKVFTILRNHNQDARIVYVGIYNPFSAYFPNVSIDDKIIHRWSQTGKHVASQYKDTAYVRTYDIFSGRTKELISGDHFHPNPRGYDLIGERVMKVIDIGKEPIDE